jgi:hypothetical protein
MAKNVGQPLEKRSKNVREQLSRVTPEEASRRIHQWLMNKGFQVGSARRSGPGFGVNDNGPYVRETTMQPAAHEAGHMMTTPPGQSFESYQKDLNSYAGVDGPPGQPPPGFVEEQKANGVEHAVHRRAGAPVQTLQVRNMGIGDNHARDWHKKNRVPHMQAGSKIAQEFDDGRREIKPNGTVGPGTSPDAVINQRAVKMKKAEKLSLGNWQGRPILEADHAHDLDQRAALHEFQGGVDRRTAEDRAHSDYRAEHHKSAAAFHLTGMRAAQASGHQEEAKKHGAMYALHLKAIGHDPYAEVPPEIRQRAEGEDAEKLYRFKAHKGDALLLNQEHGEKTMSTQSTQKSEKEPTMADTKLTPEQELRKFWDDKYAQTEKKLQKAEKLATITKAVKLAAEVLAKSGNAGQVGGGDATGGAPMMMSEPCKTCGKSEQHDTKACMTKGEDGDEKCGASGPDSVSCGRNKGHEGHHSGSDPKVRNDRTWHDTKKSEAKPETRLQKAQREAREFFDKDYNRGAGFTYENE